MTAAEFEMTTACWIYSDDQLSTVSMTVTEDTPSLHLYDPYAEEIKSLPWSTFVAGCQAPELVQHLKERRLYVNDTVAGEEEI